MSTLMTAMDAATLFDTTPAHVEAMVAQFKLGANDLDLDLDDLIADMLAATPIPAVNTDTLPVENTDREEPVTVSEVKIGIAENSPWSKDAISHFLNSVDKDGVTMPGQTTPCWEYAGEWASNHGWGGGGKIRLTHGEDKAWFICANRFAWQHYNGAFTEPEAVHVSSKCSNQNCCNPAHLKLVAAHNHKVILVEKSKTGTQAVPPILRRKAV